MFNRLWKYIKGYLIIVIEGFFIEKFINLASNAELKFWDLKRLSVSKIEVKTGIRDFKKIRPIVKKSKCRARIEKKVGLPFILNRYHKRTYFMIGFILFLVLCFISSLFVWKVEITGNETVNNDEMISQLQECGLSVGKLRHFLNEDRLVEQMMIKRDDLAWIGIEMKGIKAEVKIVEKAKKPDMIDKDSPCNIISNRVGIVTTLNVMVGAKQVEIGDTVQNGQILVSGVVEGKYPEDTRKVHALADIEMRVWYEGKASVEINGENIITEEEAKSTAYNNAYNSIIENLPSDIKISNKTVEYIIENNIVTANMVVECIERVGIEEKIL